MRIELSNVSRRFDESTALVGVELALEAGERIGLLGPSGSGKTTLLRLLAGSLRSTTGAVAIDGADLATARPRALRDHRRRTALLEQGESCVGPLSVHANVALGLVPSWPWYRSLSAALWPRDLDRTEPLLADVGLAERIWDRADSLSGGQRQRVAIARALVSRPSLLLLDEPTSALDPETAARVLSVVEERRREDGIVVLSTHRASEILDRVDRVIGLSNGEVVFDRAVADVDRGLLEDLYAGTDELA